MKDYLTEDPEIKNQKLVLLSFCPPKTYNAKEFRRPIREVIEEKLNKNMELWIENCKKAENDEMLKKELLRGSVETLTKLFVDMENSWIEAVHKGGMGAVKVRGVFDNDHEGSKAADERCMLLKNYDKHFHIFKGQVGYWLPFNQPVQTIDEKNTKHSDEKLNDVMHSYLKNKIQAEVFEKERQDEMQKAEIMKSLEREKEESNAKSDESNGEVTDKVEE